MAYTTPNQDGHLEFDYVHAKLSELYYSKVLIYRVRGLDNVLQSGVIRDRDTTYCTPGGCTERSCDHVYMSGTLKPYEFSSEKVIIHDFIEVERFGFIPGLFVDQGQWSTQQIFSVTYNGTTKSFEATKNIVVGWNYQSSTSYAVSRSGSNIVFNRYDYIWTSGDPKTYSYRNSITVKFSDATSFPAIGRGPQSGYATYPNTVSTRVFDFTVPYGVDLLRTGYLLRTEEITDALRSLDRDNHAHIAEQLQNFRSNMVAYARDMVQVRDLFKSVATLVKTEGKAILSPDWWASTYLSYHYGWRLTVKDTTELYEALTSSDDSALIVTDTRVECPSDSKWAQIHQFNDDERTKFYNGLTEDEQIEASLYELASSGQPFLPLLSSVAMAAAKSYPKAIQTFRSRHKVTCTDKYGTARVERYLLARVAMNPKERLIHLFNQTLYQWDAQLSAANLWDLVPFSFVIDWFTNVGDILDYEEKLSAFNTFPITYLIDTVKISRPLDYFSSIGNGDCSNLNVVRYNRAILDGSTNRWYAGPEDEMLSFSIPDPSHLKEGIALLVANKRQ